MIECADVRAIVRRGEVPRGVEVDAHVSSCSACGEIVRAPSIGHGLDSLARSDTGDTDALLAVMRSRLEQERGWSSRLREASTTVRDVVAALVVLGVPALVLVAAPRPDIGVYPWARLTAEGLGYALAALAAAMLALWPLHRTEPRSARLVAAVGGVAASIIIASWPDAHHDHPAALAGAGDDFVRRAMGCLMYGTICGLPVWFALRVLTRRGKILGDDAWLVAFAAAGSGAAAVFVHCPIAHAGHRWAGHVSVLVVLLLWAAWHVYRGRKR